MDAISKMWMQSSEGQRALAERRRKEEAKLERMVKERINVDSSSLFANLDQASDKGAFFSTLQSLYDPQKNIFEEKRQYFLDFGINVKEDYFPSSETFGRIILAQIFDHYILNSDLSNPKTLDTIQHLYNNFPSLLSDAFSKQYKTMSDESGTYNKIVRSDWCRTHTDADRLKILYPIIWHNTYPPYTTFGSFTQHDRDDKGNIINVDFSSYNKWRDALPDDAKLKILNQILLYNRNLTEEQLGYINEEHKSLSGSYFDKKTRVKSLFNSLMTKGNFNNGEDILSKSAVKEIEDSDISRTLFDDFLSSQDIKTLAKAYTLLHHHRYNDIPFIEELRGKILENTDSEILNHLDHWNWNNEDVQKARANAYLYFYQKDKLNSEQMTDIRSLFAYGYYSPEIKNIFYQREDTLVNPKDLGRAIKNDVVDSTDIEKLNILSWDKESKHTALANLLCYKKILRAEDNIKNKYLQTTICLLNAVNIDEYIQSDSAPNIKDIALVACYCKGKISGFDKLIEQAVKEIRKDQYIGYEYEPLMAELASRGEKLFSANELISYRKRGIEVDITENPQLYDFNDKFLCEASYHHSDGSHTTFLNEMLWYGDKEGVVLALNNGATPFTKAGFFRDKFEAMPFNMFFNRELKQGNKEGLKDFMVYIASNLEEDKKKVLQDIWTSLGKVLKEKNEVKEIINECNQAFIDSIKKRKELAQKEKEEQKRKKHQEDLQNLQNNITKEIGDYLLIADNKDITKTVDDYIKQHKDEIPFVPQSEEIENINKAINEEKERKIAEQKRLEEQKAMERKENLSKLQSLIQKSLGDNFVSSADSIISEKMVEYMKENKDTLPLLPTTEELSVIHENLLIERDKQIETINEQDKIASQRIYEDVNHSIKIYTWDHKNELAPDEYIKERINNFCNDHDEDVALSRVEEKTTKEIILLLQKERYHEQEADKNFDKVADHVLEKFFNDPDNVHGASYFGVVGKERRSSGYATITEKIMKKLSLNIKDNHPLPEIGEYRKSKYRVKVEEYEKSTRVTNYNEEYTSSDNSYSTGNQDSLTENTATLEPTIENLANVFGANLIIKSKGKNK